MIGHEGPGIGLSRDVDGLWVVRLTGNWGLTGEIPSMVEVEQDIEKDRSVRGVTFDAKDLGDWDSGLLICLVRIIDYAKTRNITVDYAGLPVGVRGLLDLAYAVAEQKAAPHGNGSSVLTRAGEWAFDRWESGRETLEFIGGTVTGLGRMLTGRARFRLSDFLLVLQECGAQALPIVSLISVLVGLILAFVGSIQLRLFGAQIYIADLVGIAMVRAMGAIMAGIIMAGRTGAAFAARIGTMQVNEELDALRTAGIPPVEFLVVPRIVAMAIMMPLLTIYADLMGILGGLIVGTGGFDITLREYLNETKGAITLNNLWIGVFSGFVFGILIAFSGCLRGMQCGRSASAVGDATTSAVVTGIVSIIVATAIITIVCNILGI